MIDLMADSVPVFASLAYIAMFSYYTLLLWRVYRNK